MKLNAETAALMTMMTRIETPQARPPKIRVSLGVRHGTFEGPFKGK